MSAGVLVLQELDEGEVTSLRPCPDLREVRGSGAVTSWARCAQAGRAAFQGGSCAEEDSSESGRCIFAGQDEQSSLSP